MREKDSETKNHRTLRLAVRVLVMFALFSSVEAQTTAFSYQGRLDEGGVAANGNFLLQFRLFDALGGGAQMGPTLMDVSVNAVDGVFSTRLDFGANALSGADRFLEIAVRRNAGQAYTTLNPRQQIASSPYSIRTLSAAQADNSDRLGGILANQYLQTSGNGSGLTNLNANSVTTGTLSNSRLGQIPTANIADAAVTANKIAAGQTVKSINTLRDDVTLAASGNITITPAGNTLTIGSTGGAGGVGGSGTPDSIPFWSNGTTLGTSLITQSAGAVNMPRRVTFAPSDNGETTVIHTPNSETGLTFANAAGRRADIRYGTTGTLRIVNGLGGIPGDSSGLAIDTLGNVGIGPTTGIARLSVAGANAGGISVTATGGVGLSVATSAGTSMTVNPGNVNNYAAQMFGRLMIDNNLEIRGQGKGIVFKSPSGNRCILLTIDEAGNLFSAIVTCP